MTHSSATGLPFYNRYCLWILDHFHYSVNTWMHKQGPLGHILVLSFPITLCIMSFISLKEIGPFVFVYHFLNLVFKLIIAYYSNLNYNKSRSRGNYSLKPDKITPHFIKFLFLIASVAFIALTAFFAFLPVFEITINTVFSLAIGLSIVINTLDSIYNGIVALYGATV